MPLIDDIEFYGSRVDAGDIPRDQATQLLADASDGLLTLRSARQAIDTWKGYRARMQAIHADVADMLRAAQNGRPVPEHVLRNQSARLREQTLRMIRRTRRDLP